MVWERSGRENRCPREPTSGLALKEATAQLRAVRCRMLSPAHEPQPQQPLLLRRQEPTLPLRGEALVLGFLVV